MTTQPLHRLTISVIEGKELSQKDRNGTSDPFVSVRILTIVPNSLTGTEPQTPNTGTNANVVDNANNTNAGTEANGANPQKRRSNKVKLFKKSDSGKSPVRENIVLRGIRTHVIKKTLNPQWDEVFEIDIDLADNFMLVFTCWDKDLLINDFMGEVRIPARRLLANPGQGVDEWFDLQPRQGRRDKVGGSLHLAISYVETTTQPETNTINVPANGAKPTSPRRNWALSPKMSRRFKSPIFSRDSERFRELVRQFSKLVSDCLESGKLDPLEKQLNQYKKDNLDLKTFFSCDMWDNKSPLSEALRKNNKEAVKILLKFNADPNRALCDSAQTAETELARQLIDEYGADANCEFEGEETTMTPLSYCLTNTGLTLEQKVSIIKLLLEKGADPLKRVAFHANAYQYVRKEVENEKEYTALISALKINGSDSFILPRYSFVGLDRPMPRSEPLLVPAGQKVNLREFLPKNIEQSPAEADFKSIVVNAEYKENEIGIVELSFRLTDKNTPTVVRVLFHVFNKNRVAYFTDVWYEVDQGVDDQCENITVALGMNPYIYYSKKTTHVDDCQYTLVYVYWTRPTDDETAATEDKQKSDIEKAKNNKEEEKYQYTSFRYISAVGMSSIPPRPMKGRRYFSSELPRDEESQDLPRPLRYGGQNVNKLEEDDKNNKNNTNTNTNSILNNSNTTSDIPAVNSVTGSPSGRRSLSMSTPTKTSTPVAEITIPREQLSPRSEVPEIGSSVVFNDLFACVATGTATQLKTMLDNKTYPVEELNQCLTKACLIFAPKKAALLLKAGAEPAFYDATDGVYPIHRAVQYASFANDIIIHKMGLNVRLFVSKGVDLTVKDKKGNGVMDYVPFKHKAKIESALKEKRGFEELYKSVLAEIEKDEKK